MSDAVREVLVRVTWIPPLAVSDVVRNAARARLTSSSAITIPRKRGAK